MRNLLYVKNDKFYYYFRQKTEYELSNGIPNFNTTHRVWALGGNEEMPWLIS